MLRLKLSKLFTLTCLFVLAFVAMSYGQIDTTANLSIGEILDGLKNIESVPQAFVYELAISTVLMNVAGYLSPIIPGIKNIPNAAWRVLAFIIVVVSIIAVIGVDINVVTQVVAYFFSSKLYDLVFTLFKKTSKPEEGLQGVLSVGNKPK